MDIDPTLIIGDTVTDEDNPASDSSVQEQPIVTFLQQWLGELTDRHREVIERRFGLNSYNPHTLEQATADRGITRERVRQIQMEAMKSLGR